jgi:tRNA threonylcarbamoyladenosine biosynthesis protein TsaE
MKKFVTENADKTQKLGELFAQELLVEKFERAKIICLEGDLGAGKTTFTQGLLKGLGAEGPYTSPTFVIMKEYNILEQGLKACHIDAYRISEPDILNLGWEELVLNKNVIIVEWPERIKKIVPPKAVWIKFKWLEKNRREIEF